MIAASVKDSDKIVDLLLSRGADINEKSMPSSTCRIYFYEPRTLTHS